MEKSHADVLNVYEDLVQKEKEVGSRHKNFHFWKNWRFWSRSRHQRRKAKKRRSHLRSHSAVSRKSAKSSHFLSPSLLLPLSLSLLLELNSFSTMFHHSSFFLHFFLFFLSNFLSRSLDVRRSWRRWRRTTERPATSNGRCWRVTKTLQWWRVASKMSAVTLRGVSISGFGWKFLRKWVGIGEWINFEYNFQLSLRRRHCVRMRRDTSAVTKNRKFIFFSLDLWFPLISPSVWQKEQLQRNMDNLVNGMEMKEDEVLSLFLSSDI